MMFKNFSANGVAFDADASSDVLRRVKDKNEDQPTSPIDVPNSFLNSQTDFNKFVS